MKRVSTNLFLGFACFSSSILSFAAPHKAHEHGKAELDVAIDGTKVAIEFESPAESIYGFEHEAKKAKDIEARDKAVKILKEKAAVLFQFAPEVGCELTEAKVEPWVKEDDAKEDASDKNHAKHGKKKHAHAEHGEVHADYTFVCKKPLTGSKLTVTLTDSFPKLRSIKIQLVSDQKQSGLILKSSKQAIDL